MADAGIFMALGVLVFIYGYYVGGAHERSRERRRIRERMEERLRQAKPLFTEAQREAARGIAGARAYETQTKMPHNNYLMPENPKQQTGN